MARLHPITVTLADGRACVIRSAEPGDAERYARHERGMRGTSDHLVTTDGDPDRPAEHIRGMIDRNLDSPQRLGLIALVPAGQPARPDDAEVIGSLEFHGHEQGRIAHTGMFGVNVSQAFRGLGVGRALIAALLDWAAAHETIERVVLGVMDSNERARKLYRSMGFVEECRRRRFFKLAEGRYADDIQMVLYVKPGTEAPGFKVWNGNNQGSRDDRTSQPSQSTA